MMMGTFLRRKWRVAVAGVAVLALLLTGGVTLFLTGHHPAKASGVGGGFCFNNDGPACSFRGAIASAEVQQFDANTCILTEEGIFASENITHPTTAGGFQGPSAFVSLFQFNPCNYYSYPPIQAFGFADNITFHADGNLNTASASGSATLTDFNTGTTYPATFDVTWTGVGSVVQTMDSQTTRTADSLVHFRTTGDSRLALANGSLTINGTNYLLTPVTGFVMTSQGGTIQIEHP